MTAHSGFPWKMGEPVTDELVEEVAACTQHNYGQGMGSFVPGCYGIFTPVDRLIYTFGGVLDSWDRTTDFKEHVQTAIRANIPDGENPDEYDFFVDLAMRAFPLMTIPKKKQRPWQEQYTKIDIPEVRKVYPDLIA